MKETVDYHGQKITRWSVGPSTFVAAPELGARLMHWHVQLADGTVRDVVYWPELRSMDEFARVRGGNPILFPFCGRTFDQGEIHCWRDTAGVRRQMPMHGFARQGRFEVTRMHDTGFTAVLRPTAADAEAFPYKYDFSVSYRFRPTGLDVELSLKNTDRQPVPWSPGHHFYFTLPWREGSTRADYELRLDAAHAVRHLGDGRLSAPLPVANPDSFANPDLSDRIHYGLRSREVRVQHIGGTEALVLQVGAEAAPPESHALVTWTPDASAPFYCVEPWMGPPNSPENKVGYHLVKPGQSQRFVVAVDVL